MSSFFQLSFINPNREGRVGSSLGPRDADSLLEYYPVGSNQTPQLAKDFLANTEMEHDPAYGFCANPITVARQRSILTKLPARISVGFAA